MRTQEDTFVGRPDDRETFEEANLVGTWFARAGALAILIGAGFAFRWGVEQGIIVPAARVLIGLAAGAAFVGWGEWARRHRWDRFGQAVTAGGLALAYLSVLASYQLYHLVPGSVAFAALVGIAASGAALAHVHDSYALAALSLVGAFLNPFLAAAQSDPRPFPTFVYLVAVDLGLLRRAFSKWRGLDVLALAGTAIVFGVVQESATPEQAGLFATALLAVFTAIPFVRPRPGAIEDVLIPVVAAFGYFAYGEHLLTIIEPSMRGAFGFALAGAYAGLWGFARVSRPADTALGFATLGLAASFAVLAVPFQLDGAPLYAAWSVEGLVLLELGTRMRFRPAEYSGMGLLTVSAYAAFFEIVAYDVPRLLVSGTGISMLIVTSCLFAAAASLRHRYGDASSAPALFGAAATSLGLLWLSAEAVQHVVRTQPEASRAAAVQFALSLTWAGFATVMLFAGVVARIRAVRLFGAGLLGIVVLKLGFVDVWTLDVGMRTIVFVGVGATLLASSVMYQRLRDFVLQPDEGSTTR